MAACNFPQIFPVRVLFSKEMLRQKNILALFCFVLLCTAMITAFTIL